MYQPPYDPNEEYAPSEPTYTVDGVPVDPYEEDPAYQTPPPDDADFHAPRKWTIFKPRLGRPNFIVSVLVNAVRFTLLSIVLLGLAMAGAVFGIAKAYMETAPTLDLALLSEQDKTSFIYDSDGNVITDYKGTENRVMVSIAQMPANLQHAFVAVEDARFYTHNGVDLKRIIGSFVQNFTSNTNQGGSTITQQLIKNTVLSSELSYKRKIQEAYLAMQLETMYTKDQILECYLNTIYLGENYYGVEVAAEGYFGKSLSGLSLRECAMLAGLTNNPYYYNPRKNFYVRQSDQTDYKALTNNRTDYVLKCMYENEFITYQEYQDALVQTTASVLQTSTTEGEGMYPYAHYVEYAVKEVVDCFLKLNNLEDTSENRYKMENELRTGGYHVTLAIDTQIQQIVEDTLENWTKYPALRDPSDKVYRAKNSDGSYTEVVQPQAAAVVLDYRTGELKAIVGGRTKPTQRKTLNRATDMKMPVGSAIKPISVYAPAIELGASPASIVYNMPLPISGWKNDAGEDTWPKNYNGGGYTGPVTLREAMKRSQNVSAAQTLLTLVGVDRSLDFLLKLGVDRDNIDATPFGLALGSSGITPVQMAVAYGVLGNGGVYQKPISFLGISDSDGNVVWDSHQQQERRQVFRASTAWLVVDMMKDVVSGGTATKAKISGQTVAGKTGTNSDQRGIFFCGLTGWYSSSLWIGHDNYKPLSSKASGGNSATLLWQSYMAAIHKAKNLDNKDILDGDPADYGLTKVTTCAVSGQLATDACANDIMGYGTVTDYWYTPTVPTTQCQMHRSMTVCTESNMIATPYCPSTTVRGVVVIPEGHPLYRFVNDPEYSSVLTEYLGSASDTTVCPLHGEGYVASGSTDPIVQNTLIPDARTLIQSAQGLMNSIDSGTELYQNISAAINALQGLIDSGNPSSSDIAAAMSQLTQAMAAAY
ncbi:MAG TPA: PBP1A family penicillin-binding protein [Candidatus Limiplasma sp.]|nr:PBP1A family penicillin-binding protein [Candidatus Limiplasma sp.]